jgi:hypothetical protein
MDVLLTHGPWSILPYLMSRQITSCLQRKST